MPVISWRLYMDMEDVSLSSVSRVSECYTVGLSCVGRRVSQAYLTMFLQTHHTSHSPADFASILSTTLSDTSLGAYVAPSWQLNRVLLWNPPLDRYVADKLNERVARGEELDEESQKEAYSVFKQAGMHKIMGDAVQAVFGGVFHQFVSKAPLVHTIVLISWQGGQVAHQIFHTRILPHLDLPKTGLPEPFKTRQRDIRNKWAHTTTNKLELEAIEPEESRIES